MARKKKVQVWLFRQKDDGAEFLLLKRPPGWKSGEFWQPITGSVEDRETPAEAARREVREETGIAWLGEPIDTELICQFEQGKRRFKEYIFAFEAFEDDLTISTEHEDFGWFNFSAALEKLHFTSNQTGLGAVAVLLPPTAGQAK